ncbi:hypothetical protein BWQ96_06526 [Gracilariopsis chorda]|uniref:Chitin-binding type-4 domain-containing protein n=1 Tax=Gracilariopsis chorda TaxID=448386 RepID=A0A2V3INN7_9FLOR|nr:hypothetical protein BWQ96_06526 [Gracilariopsis chorda]|eukprot:PXF43696.1 hypothetical protein BWQ96_06526 [Gracilariopsis chorda]
MCTPRQRGAYHSQKCGSNLQDPSNPVIDYCGHCLNGGTVAGVKKNLGKDGWSEYDPIANPSTLKRAGLCGDEKGKNDHMIGGKFMPYNKVPVVKRWKTGSVVDLQVEIDTNHNGYFEFYLCNLDACGVRDIAEKCFRNSCYRLNRVKVVQCESPSKNTHTKCGPVDAKYPSRFYVPCRKTGHVGVHLVGGDGTMLYQLPKGVKCNHCVLQWYWSSANSCAPRGFLDYFERYKNPFGTSCDSDGGGKGAHRQGMSGCGGQSVPEEFWSCADVSISEGGKSSATIPNGSEKKKKHGKVQKGKPSKKKRKPDKKKNPSQQPGGKKKPMKPSVSKHGSGDKRKEQPSKRRCFANLAHCNGRIPCCGREDVCVYKRSAKRFVCEIWWKLWSEVGNSGVDRALVQQKVEKESIQKNDATADMADDREL